MPQFTKLINNKQYTLSINDGSIELCVEGNSPDLPSYLIDNPFTAESNSDHGKVVLYSHQHQGSHCDALEKYYANVVKRFYKQHGDALKPKPIKDIHSDEESGVCLKELSAIHNFIQKAQQTILDTEPPEQSTLQGLIEALAQKLEALHTFYSKKMHSGIMSDDYDLDIKKLKPKTTFALKASDMQTNENQNLKQDEFYNDIFEINVEAFENQQNNRLQAGENKIRESIIGLNTSQGPQQKQRQGRE
jgi:hypothetical protein